MQAIVAHFAHGQLWRHPCAQLLRSGLHVVVVLDRNILTGHAQATRGDAVSIVSGGCPQTAQHVAPVVLTGTGGSQVVSLVSEFQ